MPSRSEGGSLREIWEPRREAFEPVGEILGAESGTRRARALGLTTCAGEHMERAGSGAAEPPLAREAGITGTFEDEEKVAVDGIEAQKL